MGSKENKPKIEIKNIEKEKNDDINEIDDEYEIKENDIHKSFIDIDLIKHTDESKFCLDIIWIDEKVFNSENQDYFKDMNNNYPNININLFNNLEEGFNKLLSLEFVSIFVIVSGRLYSQYYHKLKNNLDKIKCLPINIIFTSVEIKNKY